MPANQVFAVSRWQLARAAATVGALPSFVTPQQRRPLLEISWRVLQVWANLAVADDNWIRSTAYDRLDPSEKTAVSYFLGMVQAQLACKALLGFSHLTHVDALLRAAGQPQAGTRPDFLAVNALNTTYVATVEAKGRSNGFDQSALNTAKEQAGQILGILTPTKLHIASEAFFARSGAWSVVLEDPPARGPQLPLTVNDVLVEYYRPLIEAGRSTREWSERDRVPSFRVLGTDLRIGVPAQIVAAFDESEASRAADRSSQGEPLLEAYKTTIADLPDSEVGLASNSDYGAHADAEGAASTDLVFTYEDDSPEG